MCVDSCRNTNLSCSKYLQACTHTCTQARARTHARTRIHTHARTHAHTHTYTHIHTGTRTHTCILSECTQCDTVLCCTGQNETLGGANSSTAIGTTPERTPPSVSPAASNISSRPLIPFIVSPVTSTTMAAPHSTTTTTISTIASETRTINRTLVVGGATNHYAVEGAIPTPPVQGDVAHVIDRPFGDRVANDSSNSSTTIAPVKDKSAHYVDSSVVEREGGRNVSVTNELDHRSVSSNGTVGERRHVIVQSNSGEVRVMLLSR